MRKVCTGVDCYLKTRKRELTLRPEKINALLGTSIDANTMIELLETLEFKVDRIHEITVPTFRGDVEREADIAEIARLYDYNRIDATLLEGKSSTVGRRPGNKK